MAEDNVQEECKTLIRGLNNDEIHTLYGIAAEQTDLNPVTIRELINKSLLIAVGAGRRDPRVAARAGRLYSQPPDAAGTPAPDAPGDHAGVK